jgi:uncharacterized MnhB-related membrane protein
LLPEESELLSFLIITVSGSFSSIVNRDRLSPDCAIISTAFNQNKTERLDEEIKGLLKAQQRPLVATSSPTQHNNAQKTREPSWGAMQRTAANTVENIERSTKLINLIILRLFIYSALYMIIYRNIDCVTLSASRVIDLSWGLG